MVSSRGRASGTSKVLFPPTPPILPCHEPPNPPCQGGFFNNPLKGGVLSPSSSIGYIHRITNLGLFQQPLALRVCAQGRKENCLHDSRQEEQAREADIGENRPARLRASSTSSRMNLLKPFYQTFRLVSWENAFGTKRAFILTRTMDFHRLRFCSHGALLGP